MKKIKDHYIERFEENYKWKIWKKHKEQLRIALINILTYPFLTENLDSLEERMGIINEIIENKDFVDRVLKNVKWWDTIVYKTLKKVYNKSLQKK